MTLRDRLAPALAGLSAACFLSLGGVALASETPVPAIAASAAFAEAKAHLAKDFDRTVADIITLTEIPAPPFQEAERAKAYLAMLEAHGLTQTTTDAEGNVMGLRRGAGPAGGPLVVVSAHLDTVFPADTDVTVRREGTRLMAPGIGDDTRSLATLLAFIRAMDAAGLVTEQDILFLGTVGEEGQGDLRGVRHFFTEGPYRDRVSAFFSFDGSDPTRVVTGAVGSKRYRTFFRGPGGHSYGAFGLVNPMAAMARATAQLYEIELPPSPRTTYSASVTGGGVSVNSIPAEVYTEYDMRSESPEALARLEAQLLAIFQESVAAENAARSTAQGPITVEPLVIGDRPAGSTDPDSGLVRSVVAAIEAAGYSASLSASSTDSNIPMSLGVPAITMGSGGSGGRAHALDEWIDVEPVENVRGMGVGLLAILAVAGVR
ncbi:MAG: M20/M25/M40 family metallo-hydrolase [Phenylobacterium sp.]|uniref:M20/M25/M40 family metallo-hydrolase n=1 Tax=Phenylobacterium sp. TaxID=1871053 RepID=UPI00271793E3|nr:M20/M25/M40 family metallo-hydrolase [Phenylobacterium sp.]MDO8901035.1 M20/M25/M40 family metallo-hydrolase [Phenylobacterium sp.]